MKALEITEFDDLYKKYAEKYSLDWLLVKAQAVQESGQNPKAENPYSHAKGLMQFMDATWLEWEDESPGIQNEFRDYDPFNPEDSVRAGCAYMNWLVKYFKGDYTLALMAYNWGCGNMLNYLRGKAKSIPLETLEYHVKIKKWYWMLKEK